MRIAHSAVACLGFLAVAGPAAAGPVWINYKFDSNVAPNPAGGAGFAKFEQHFAGQHALTGERRLATFRFMPLAATPPIPAAWDERVPFPFDGVTLFAMKVELTDVASGEMGVVRLTGSARSSWTRMPDGQILAGPATFEFDGDKNTDLTLGGNDFVIRAVGGSTADGSDIQATVSVGIVTPEVLQTPEPGTLILSAFGVTVAGAVRARRRRGRG